VKIPSFKDSLGISKWVKKELEGSGYKVDSDEDGNMIAETGNKESPGFILNAHLDTVAPGDGWIHDPFGGEVKDGKLYGRGSSDCKAGVASMLEISRILAKEKLKKRVVFAFTAFEEGYPLEKNGVYRILPKLRNIEKGLIMEPSTQGSEIGIAVGCRGSVHCKIEILGKRGHSSRPDLYDNPIYKFPKLLEEIKNFPSREMDIKIVNQKIRDNMTVTEICAKEGVNVIPGKCEVSIDRRALPGEDPKYAEAELEKICRKVLGDKFRLLETRAIQGYCCEDRKLLGLCKDVIKSKGMKPNPYFLLARIDGSILKNFAKIGTFELGPGSMSVAHEIDEYCELEGFLRTTDIVLEIIRKWDKGR